MEEATEKAVILARAAIAKVHLNTPLQPGESRVTKRALVIGGGIAGIQTADVYKRQGRKSHSTAKWKAFGTGL